jgi:hypothetical protein
MAWIQRRRLTATTIFLLASLSATSRARAAESAAEAELLPDAALDIEFVHYTPKSVDQVWDTIVGARAGLARWRATTVFVGGEIETVLGTERRETDANQGSYHIELGLDQYVSTLRVTPFFHHVSRHALDRAKPEAVDWNVLGVRLDGPWPRDARRPLTAGLGVGRTTLASLVGYRWEITGQVDDRLLATANLALHCRGRARLVTAESSEAFPRGTFLDWSLELAARLTHKNRVLEPFVAWEHRNDVLLSVPDVRTRLLIGLRLGIPEQPGRPSPAER